MRMIVTDKHLNQHRNFILNMAVLGVKTSFARSSGVINKRFVSNYLEDSSSKTFLLTARK
jgi:hypothetical protein